MEWMALSPRGITFLCQTSEKLSAFQRPLYVTGAIEEGTEDEEAFSHVRCVSGRQGALGMIAHRHHSMLRSSWGDLVSSAIKKQA